MPGSVSKTRMRAFVKNLQWRAVRDALRASPDTAAYRDDRGRNWLHIACSVNVEARELRPAAGIRTADVLLDAGFGIDEPAFSEADFAATPLWFAVAHSRNVPLVRHLLARGASAEHCMWAAVNRDSPELIRLLQEHGASDPTNDEASPLLSAIAWNRYRAAAALLGQGADPNYRNRDGITPLHLLLKKRADVKHVRLLLQHGARTDIPDAAGHTAGELLGRRRDPAFRALASG